MEYMRRPSRARYAPWIMTAAAVRLLRHRGSTTLSLSCIARHALAILARSCFRHRRPSMRRIVRWIVVALYPMRCSLGGKSDHDSHLSYLQ